MATSIADGSQTATGGEDTLDAAITTDGSFVLELDTSNMALGDILIIRVKTKVRSVGTTRLIYETTYAHVQGEPVIASIPVASTNEIIFTIEQTAGTNRAYPFEIWSL